MRHRVAVAARVGGGEAVAGVRARHAETQAPDFMAAGLQLPVDRLRHVGFDHSERAAHQPHGDGD
jgi:hypothetical protein